MDINNIKTGLSPREIIDNLNSNLNILNNSIYNTNASLTTLETNTNANISNLQNEDINLQTQIDNKVDKVAGEGLTPNPFTNAEKDKLATLENFNDSQLKADIALKADITYVDTQDTGLQTQITTLKNRVDNAETAEVFATEQAMLDWIAVPENIQNLPIGFRFLIEDVNSPNYWWNGTAPVEDKSTSVDLSNYYNKSQTLSTAEIQASEANVLSTAEAYTDTQAIATLTVDWYLQADGTVTQIPPVGNGTPMLPLTNITTTEQKLYSFANVATQDALLKFTNTYGALVVFENMNNNYNYGFRFTYTVNGNQILMNTQRPYFSPSNGDDIVEFISKGLLTSDLSIKAGDTVEFAIYGQVQADIVGETPTLALRVGNGTIPSRVVRNKVVTTFASSLLTNATGDIQSQEQFNINTYTGKQNKLVEGQNIVLVDNPNGTTTIASQNTVPSTNFTAAIYMDSATTLSNNKPTGTVQQSFALTNSNVAVSRILTYTFPTAGEISASSLYGAWLYFTSLRNQQDYRVETKWSIGATDISVGATVFQTGNSQTSGIFFVPMNTNLLTNNIPVAKDTQLSLTISVTRIGGNNHTVQLTSTPTLITTFVRNGGDVSSSNVYDFDSTDVATQYIRNRTYENQITTNTTNIATNTTNIATLQQNRPLQTTAPITKTVDIANLQAEIDALPKITSYNVIFNVNAGTYNGIVTINGFQSLNGATITINGSASLASTHNISNIVVSNCDIRVSLNGFNLTGAGDALTISACTKPVMPNYIRTASVGNTGIYYVGYTGHSIVNNCEISNKTNSALRCVSSYNVQVANITGTGNNIGISSEFASRIAVRDGANTLVATTPYNISSRGMIIDGEFNTTNKTLNGAINELNSGKLDKVATTSFTDFNNLITGGMYYSQAFNNTAPISNSPIPAETNAQRYAVVVIASNPQRVQQLAILQQGNAVNDGRIFTRSLIDTTWGTWRELSKVQNYSTTETFTGSFWIDGKPIYRKVVDCGALPNATTKTVSVGNSNVDANVRFYGYSSDGTNDISLPFLDVNGNGAINVELSMSNKSTIVIRTKANMSTFIKTYVTVEYTKTV